jgi:hypothetical protein
MWIFWLSLHQGPDFERIAFAIGFGAANSAREGNNLRRSHLKPTLLVGLFVEDRGSSIWPAKRK